jgi:hypothetical protein
VENPPACGQAPGTTRPGGKAPREREKWPSARDDHFSRKKRQEELLAAGALLVEDPEDELDDAADEPLPDPDDELSDEPPVDDSDLAGLLVVLVVLSEPDERESVR